MGLQFPATPTFTDFDAPVRIECDIYDLEVIGDLPRELEGSWYRCGPDTQYPPHLGDDIYINGDGMTTLFRFSDGHVDFKSRFVQTDRWKAERAARRSLFGKYRNPFTDKPEVKGLSRGVANTTPLWHGGRLLVFKEDDVPWELDPDTLATVGAFTWNGKLRSKTITAHPKIDPETGECILFGFECEGDGSSTMSWIVTDPQGEIVREEWFEPPYVGMVHDFAITRDYVMFPVMPTIMDPERLRAGGDHWKWVGDQDAWMGIMSRREGVKSLRWYKMPASFAFHTINGFNEGTTASIDMMVAKRNAFPFIGDIDPKVEVTIEDGMPFATRWSFDTTSNTEDGAFRSTQLSPIPGELPMINLAKTAVEARYTYIAMIDPSRRMLKGGPMGFAPNMIGKLDLKGGPPQFYAGADETGFQEGQFIPRGPGEDEGWFINVADHRDQNRSDLLVFDAQHIDQGPVCTVRLPLRLRLAFHTTWVSDADRARGDAIRQGREAKRAA